MYVTDAWSGVNKSTDGGQTWFASNTGITTRSGPSDDAIPIFSLAIDEQDPNIVWAGTQGLRGIFKSTNGGTSWSQSLSGSTQNANDPSKLIMALVVHPKNDSVVFAADWRSGIYRTTNAGSSWELINTGLSTRAVNSLSISSDGLYLYAGTKGEGVFRLQTASVSAPAAPVLLSPENGAINQSLNVTLTWNPVSTADTYELQVAADSLFNAVSLSDTTLTNPSRTIGPLALNTTYYWRVRALNLGGTSGWSAVFKFKTIQSKNRSLPVSIESRGTQDPIRRACTSIA